MIPIRANWLPVGKSGLVTSLFSILEYTLDCYRSALACVPLSAFGGLVSCIFRINKRLALELNKIFLKQPKYRNR